MFASADERTNAIHVQREDEGDERAQAEHRAKLAAAKMLGTLNVNESHKIRLDKSLYGAALLLPQLARSAGYPKNIVILCIRSYIFLIVNYLCQGLVLYMIAKEELIWDAFAGQMFLCDFGRNSGECPNGPDCVGPGGTTYTPSRVYSWNVWSTRIYVRDALLALFPERSDDIHGLVDPGEYGLESYWCRWLCCALFTATLLGDLMGSVNILRIFWDIPNKAESWLDYEVPDWAEKEHAKAIHGWSEVDLCKLRVAGMPLHWKIINIFVIVIPKFMLWSLTAQSGITFLMETSAIDDMVVNSVALAFILQIDELLCSELMSETSKQILEMLEDYELSGFEEANAVERMREDELLQEYQSNLASEWSWREMASFVPYKLILVLVFTFGFVELYYSVHCVRSEDGGYVSREMHLPLSTRFSFWAFFGFFFPMAKEDEPFWVMPHAQSN
ncbi:unnamed protein product [Effrenium voratum]|uniref:Uncharacterized protein n=1 Tax=Effrenium voratum TaxID=2562239 RepID=A0AA36N9P6_9DINO|nr:unnamed protein product [Effrenium voratum]